MKTRPVAGSLSVLTLLLLSVNAAHANATYSGTVNAVFIDPVPSGYVVENDGDPAETDNTGTAVYSITDPPMGMSTRRRTPIISSSRPSASTSTSTKGRAPRRRSTARSSAIRRLK